MSKRKQSNLLSFISWRKVSKQDETVVCGFNVGRVCDIDKDGGATASPSRTQTHQSTTTAAAVDGDASKCLSEPQPGTSKSSLVEDSCLIINKVDIGDFVGIQVSDEDKYYAFTNPWTPDKLYPFPSNLESGQRRKFNLKWLHEYPWLTYSAKNEGVYCRACVLFGPKAAGQKKKVALRKLVLTPLNKYNNSSRVFKNHVSKDYHQLSFKKAEEFFKKIVNPEETIILKMDSLEKQRIAENRESLIPIVKTIILCGTENIPLRGHRDDGNLDSDYLQRNEGKFRALLSFRVDAGDKILEHHLKTVSRNSALMSKATQNDLISCCGSLVVDEIVKEVKLSKYYSLIADETRDTRSVEQLAICIRYLDSESYMIKEMFVGFVEATETTGDELAKLILKKIEELGLDLTFLRGQAYDGGANMARKFKEVQARILELNPLATYVHCASHQLNLALTHTSIEPMIRNAVGTVSEAINFVKDSSKRVLLLKNINKEHDADVTRLISLCETRFIERHDALSFFLDVFGVVVVFFKAIEAEKPSTKSAGLLFAMLNFEFVLTLHILGTVLDLTAALSRDLQNPSVDLNLCYNMARTTIKLMTRYRTEPAFYDTIYENAVKVASEHNIEVRCSRIAGKQVHRSNIGDSNTKEFYRKSVFLPFLDKLISELSSRFTPAHDDLMLLFSLIPAKFPNHNGDLGSIVIAAEKYTGESKVKLRNEIELWREHWKEQKDRPASAVEAFSDPITRYCPNIKNLLRLICVLPVTSCTEKRSFSTLKLIKSYLRSTKIEDRLNGLALMNIHKNSIVLNPSNVVDKYVSVHTR